MKETRTVIIAYDIEHLKDLIRDNPDFYIVEHRWVYSGATEWTEVEPYELGL